MNQCKTCAYFAPIEKAEKPIGQCKAIPPQVLMQKIAVDAHGIPVTSALQKQVAVTEIAQAFFPVMPESDWCGQHRPIVTH
jgi:hypothetical protein